MIVLWIILSLVVYVALILIGRNSDRLKYGEGDVELCVTLFEVYARLFHRVRYEGLEHLEGLKADDAVLVVCNHTAGVDPIVVQPRLPFRARWVMAQDMRAWVLEWFWNWSETIFVDRAGGNTLGVRSVIGHLKQGHSVAMFPEGGIERPPKMLMPFMTGVGLIVSRSRVPVLPVWIEGTPQVDPAWASLWRTSKTVVRFGPVMDFEPKTKPDVIVDRLHARFRDWTGWPVNTDTRHIPEHGSAVAAS